MKYRKFGKLDFEVSNLGFGCMRLPVIDDDNGKINEDEAIKMIRFAIDNGVNYIDTAYPYHQRNSEPLVGKALKDGYRQKVKLATKLPVWLCETHEDFDRYLNEQLEKLETEYIDFYLLHSLSNKSWNKARSLGVLEFLDEALADGRIKYAGFSFHDELNVFKEIIDSYNWSFCQIQLNYMDEDYQAGIEGLKYASEKGLAVIIMEPIKGGKLAKEPRGDLKDIWEKSGINKTPAELALRWVWNYPEVTLLLSGMSSMEQVKENIKTASNIIPLSLDSDEIKLIENIKDIYNSRNKVGCTSCRYCVPCPNKVAIPDIFEIYNNYYVYDATTAGINSYERMKKAGIDSTNCIECAQCENVCPQNLEIIRYLKDADLVLNR
ncbi:aldo/keto reductase [Proteiniborus sp. MB09-C3]|uniref:aldo/keto reductase n=1 Tax=Proteiniborus sp. MB09-C3 TaxID=3050072 RepID=UPI0025561B83|nr:aldo/keto reductase [Proteiniborus sp. MB09-C3]WIV11030.1 aldo/keto reductase [Proteiniborus sp. MB09-C3]